MELTQHQADAFARMPLTYLRQEYPNHIMHLLNGDGDVLPPRELHPIFYGCFDWHSAVHGYWLLLRCLRLWPELPCREEIITLFEEHLTDEKVAKELLDKLTSGKLQIDHWREKATAQAQVKAEIIKHLFAHLPSGAYDADEINLKADAVFAHIYTAGFGEGARVYH